MANDMMVAAGHVWLTHAAVDISPKQTAPSIKRPQSLRYLVMTGIFAAVVVGAAALGMMLAQGKLEHNLAGIPHWATACPRGAAAILVIGQSQASNTGPRRHISWSESRAFDDGNCYYLRDPMPGTGGHGGTIWPEFADEISQPTVIADIAISGSAIEQWTAPDQLRKIRRTLNDLRTKGYPKPLIIWMQGETNNTRRTSADIYYQQLRILLELSPNNQWLITRESICGNDQTPWMPLNTARDRIAQEFKTVTIGPNIDALGLSLRQSDRCHFDVRGQTVIANALARFAQPLLNR